MPIDWNYFQTTNNLIQQSRTELDYIAAYFTDSSDKYKYFKELHVARNRAAAIWNANGQSETDKVEALSRFLRDIDALARRASQRLSGRKFCYIQHKEVENIDALSKALQGGLDVAKRDKDLVIVLLQRGN